MEKNLASGAWNGIVKVWDAETYNEIATFGGYDSSVLQGWLGGWRTPVSFQPGGTLLAYGALESIRLWDAGNRSEVATIENLLGSSYMDFSPDGTLLAFDTFQGVELWNVTPIRKLSTLLEIEPEADHFTPVVFSPDGTLLAFLDEIAILALWDVETGGRVASLGHTGGVWSLAFSPDGTRIASALYDGTVILSDISEFVVRPQMPDFDGDGTVGFGDFLLFAAVFGRSQGDAGYDARYDLDGNGVIGFSDFLIFAGAFGN